jgi:hypothetical protein
VACERAAGEAHREAGRGSDLETASIDRDLSLCSWFGPGERGGRRPTAWSGATYHATVVVQW